MPATMRAMVLEAPGRPLRLATLPVPDPREREILIRVGACGVCRTDLHIMDGELPAHLLPVIPGHEIAGSVVANGSAAGRFAIGQRVGVPWLASSCGSCPYCVRGRENLCDRATFTGYDRHGGFAEYVTADERYCFALPDCHDDLHAAPLLCAGLIGHRAYAMTEGARKVGMYGFGAAAHIIAQLARRQGRDVFAFTRPGDLRAQRFALSLGVCWAGASDSNAPEMLDAAILFAPDGALIPRALAATAKAAVVVCAGIHMSEVPAFPYSLLWGERVVRSVSNLTRTDGEAFFAQVANGEVATMPAAFPLARANDAVTALRAGLVDGAAVLVP